MKLEEITSTRTVDQNKLMWSLLRDVSLQVSWWVDGEQVKMSEWDWKDVFSAALRKHQHVAKGLDGGFVILGMHTSKMNKREMGDMLDIVLAFGNEHQVRWSDQP